MAAISLYNRCIGINFILTLFFIGTPQILSYYIKHLI